MPIDDRLFTDGIRWLSLYVYNVNPYTTAGRIKDHLSTYQNCKFSGETTMENGRATWEGARRPIPIEKAYRIEVGEVIDSTLPSIATVYLTSGPGPYRVIYNNGGVTAFVAYAYIQSFSQDAGGEAQADSFVLELDGDPLPWTL
jgi:hypothetical protein